MQRIPYIYVGLTARKGRGVFTSEPIDADSLIEICPVIVCSVKDRALLHETLLHDYYFMWGENDDECAIALGYGSLYNHDYKPNARYEVDFEEETIRFYSIKPIQAGEEINVNYNGIAEDVEPVWFDKG